MAKIRKFFDREQNLLVHITVTILVIIVGLFFGLRTYEWVMIFALVALVIVSELINSAVELVVDTYTSEFNSLAMVAKDTAAAGVLVSAITAAGVGLYIFIPKFVDLITKVF